MWCHFSRVLLGNLDSAYKKKSNKEKFRPSKSPGPERIHPLSQQTLARQDQKKSLEMEMAVFIWLATNLCTFLSRQHSRTFFFLVDANKVYKWFKIKVKLRDLCCFSQIIFSSVDWKSVISNFIYDITINFLTRNSNEPTLVSLLKIITYQHSCKRREHSFLSSFLSFLLTLCRSHSSWLKRRRSKTILNNFTPRKLFTGIKVLERP